MKKIAFLMALLAGITACSESSEPISFEVRDFEVERSSTAQIYDWYKGRGQIVSTSKALKGKTVLLHVKVKANRKYDGQDVVVEKEQRVLVRDGIGLIEFELNADARGSAPTFSDWSSEGYIKLEPAIVEKK